MENKEINQLIIQPVLHQFQRVQKQKTKSIFDAKTSKQIQERQILSLQAKNAKKNDELFIDHAKEEIASYFYTFMVQEAPQGFASIDSIYQKSVKSQKIMIFPAKKLKKYLTWIYQDPKHFTQPLVV